ncbi:jerky protein homolog-like [Watersipora subatra]|uniref:jerky protein homolog-like n=1 Tax=Watersipora subatra TaxID=2589382 RepID=UPI00355BE758
MNRAKAFNKAAILKFYDNLEPFLAIDAARIYNVDETGVSTVTKPVKILAARGKKRVGAVTSGERGTNTTVICCMSATGTFVPPMFIFKRIRMAPHLMNGAPVGSVGECSESGWVNEKLFLKWLQHFQKFTNCSLENPVLLIADNHSSHLSLEIWQFLRDHGINFVTIPPHTSHRIQPLDVSFFKPLKTNYAENVRLWLLKNPGKVVTPVDVAGIFNKAYSSTCRMDLAISGFLATGISPFNRSVFSDEDFSIFKDDLEAANFEVPRPHHDNITEGMETCQPTGQTNKNRETSNDQPLAADSSNNGYEISTLSTASDHDHTLSLVISKSKCVRSLISEISPKPIMNFSKAKDKSRSQSSTVLNTTPVKVTLLEKAAKKAAKKTSSEPTLTSKGNDNPAVTKKSVKGKQKRKRPPLSYSDDSDDEFNICIVCFEHFGNSTSREPWVQCSDCKHWAHEACTPGYHLYTCHNCESD